VQVSVLSNRLSSLVQELALERARSGTAQAAGTDPAADPGLRIDGVAEEA
jgi:hypothetical protein